MFTDGNRKVPGTHIQGSEKVFVGVNQWTIYLEQQESTTKVLFNLPNDTHKKIHLPKFPPRGTEKHCTLPPFWKHQNISPLCSKAWKAMIKAIAVSRFMFLRNWARKTARTPNLSDGIAFISSAPFSEIVWFKAIASF